MILHQGTRLPMGQEALTLTPKLLTGQTPTQRYVSNNNTRPKRENTKGCQPQYLPSPSNTKMNASPKYNDQTEPDQLTVTPRAEPPPTRLNQTTLNYTSTPFFQPPERPPIPHDLQLTKRDSNPTATDSPPPTTPNPLPSACPPS